MLFSLFLIYKLNYRYKYQQKNKYFRDYLLSNSTVY